MPISWNEIRQNAIAFSKEWAKATSEAAEAKSFWDEFFAVFGLRRRTVATFEEPVKKLSGQYGFIDLFWRGKLLVEHKSFGKPLDRAESQAFSYLQDLVSAGRHEEVPRYVIVSDFARIALHDLEPEPTGQAQVGDGPRVHTIEFPLCELHRHIHAFAFIPGYRQQNFDQEDPANLRAAAIMGDLHDTIAACGYTGHALERFLVRILFCLFAEDTGIFEPNSFTEAIEDQTSPDGADLGLHLARLFQVLNTPPEKRQSNLNELLARLPYVNGGLFAESLPLAELNRDIRDAVLRCTSFDWSRISPAVFGSLFQSVMEPGARRQVGAHYTSERDIMKIVRSLFLDDLRAEFERCRTVKPRLRQFLEKIAGLRFFDPACGCGNFLVIAYRELRLLEMEVLEELHGRAQGITDIGLLSQVDVDQFYGIEIEEFPALIAETAMWLMDHQMNLRLSEIFGQYFVRLPLRKSASIRHGNALRLDWAAVLPPERCSYILGNPPFVGKALQDSGQKADMELVWGGTRGSGVLDYVTCWYRKAAAYLRDSSVTAGFVSTNSITQGEQVGILWRALFACGLKIHFAHRTFAWQSEARGKAHVHVVIIGFGQEDRPAKRLYEYNGDQTTVCEVRNISPYLVEGTDTLVLNRTKPLCPVPEIVFGNMPNDGGNLLLSPAEREQLLAEEPAACQWVRPFLGAEEFINGGERWCLWLGDCPPVQLRAMPRILARVEAVRRHREDSTREATRRLAATPTLFGEIRQPDSDYLAIPKTSSERRAYIPIGFLPSSTIASTELQMIPHASLYHFGVLTSAMHMAWVRQVCGRLESRYRYSNSLVYNNYPWPAAPAEPQRAAVAAKAQAVLEARAQFPGSSLADLYDPLTMPPVLVKAHAELDRAVDRCYRSQPFATDRQRVEYLFAFYETLAAPLLPPAPAGKRRRR